LVFTGAGNRTGSRLDQARDPSGHRPDLALPRGILSFRACRLIYNERIRHPSTIYQLLDDPSKTMKRWVHRNKIIGNGPSGATRRDVEHSLFWAIKN